MVKTQERVFCLSIKLIFAIVKTELTGLLNWMCIGQSNEYSNA